MTEPPRMDWTINVPTIITLLLLVIGFVRSYTRAEERISQLYGRFSDHVEETVIFRKLITEQLDMHRERIQVLAVQQARADQFLELQSAWMKEIRRPDRKSEDLHQ